MAETLRISLLNASKLSSSALDKADVRQTVNDLLPSVESPILIVTESSFGIGFDIYKIFVLWDLFFRQKKFSGFCFVILVVDESLIVRLCVVDVWPGTHNIRHPKTTWIDFLGDFRVVVEDLFPLDVFPIPNTHRLFTQIVGFLYDCGYEQIITEAQMPSIASSCRTRSLIDTKG